MLQFEQEPGLYQRFQIDASLVWCDLDPVLRRIWASEFQSATREVKESFLRAIGERIGAGE